MAKQLKFSTNHLAEKKKLLYLWFATSVKLPLSRDVFYTYLFHELLHPYIYEILPFNRPTPLKERFENEEVNQKSKGLVIAHIHLMAVQKKVLLNLGLHDEYKRLRQVDEIRDNTTGEYLLPAYKRSWEIVDLVGEDALIKELQEEIDKRPSFIRSVGR